MLEWVKRLLLQTRCAYCSEPLSQDEEIRFGKVSICPDCFNHLGLAHSSGDIRYTWEQFHGLFLIRVIK